jgi:hypothetical protein
MREARIARARHERPIVLFGVVNGGDDLILLGPSVDETLFVAGRINRLELFTEPAEHFVLPLDRERRWAKDEDALDGFAEL